VDADATPAAAATVVALQNGDGAAFAGLVDRWYGPMVRLARVLAHDGELARRAAHDAWLLTIQELPALGRDEPVYRTLLGATLASAAARVEAGEAQPAVDPARFEPEDSRWSGWWLDAEMPRAWSADPGDDLLLGALERLPSAVAAVVLLRDVERLTPEDVEAIVGFAADEQRALLHQGRMGLWRALGPSGDGA
jgi:DNA-directed RNA polymerase specialized sigma24 family protein